MQPPRTIDAHHHVWRLDRGDYAWLTPSLRPIYRDFDLQDLVPHLTCHGIEATILVQAAATEAETAFLLEIAERSPTVAGVVGWTDFEAPDAAGNVVRLASNRLLVGLRPMVQDIEDDDWLLRDALVPAINAMIRHQLVFDALVLPRHLPRLLHIADRYPGLGIVLDHLGKPHIEAGTLDPWRDDVARLAERPNVTCKLSGMANEAGSEWQGDHLRPYVDHVLACFGPDRILWGSDWPVVNLAGGYDRWHDTARILIPEASWPAIFGGTADRVYLCNRGRK
ncbi:amidohydrolase [Acidisphaera sp. S103]|uniref:amidohydrolase family protein n=1 Tax=Acidisphaera sp. S103 TaxID=1747223 RepID=UPI00131CFA9E|nr:amidohydrolase family protein [Acidisphaera sp. S103]